MYWWQLLPLLLLSASTAALVRNDLENRYALINTSVSLHDVSDRFLSITFHLDNLPDLPWADASIIKLAREFSPAWFKVSPEQTRNQSVNREFSLYQWAALNHFTYESGFKQMWDAKTFSRAARRWNLNGLHKISDIKGVPNIYEFPPPPNQIGFTVTNRSLVDIANVKDLFPRYDTEDLTIVGPDIKFFIDYDEVKSFSKWLQMYGQSVSGISWSPSVLIRNKNESTASLLTTKHSDLFKLEQTVLRGMADQMGFGDKKIWISDLQVQWEGDELGELAGTFGAALVWLDRLGTAAVSGVDVAFQPNLLPMHVRGVRQRPSPEYWVGVLHKRLVGSRVLQVNSRCQGNAACRLFAHCTPNNTRSHYRDGSVTMFAINMKGTELKGSVVDWSQDNPMHLYVLTGDINSKKVYLNDELLEIDLHTGNLPPIRPNIIPSPRDIILPPYSMAFWVFPNIKASACATSNKRRKRSDTTHMALFFPTEDIEEEGENESTTTKQKRCYNKNQVPVAPPIIPKILLNTKILADDCPPGCHQCNKGPCQIQGLNIMAPGCTTSQLLQRLIDLSRKRRTECCCDGKDGPSTIPYEHTDYKQLKLADNNDIAYTDTAVTPRLGPNSTPIDNYFPPSVDPEYSTNFNNDVYSQTQHATHHYDEPKKTVVAVLKDYSSPHHEENFNESPSVLVQQYKDLVSGQEILDDNRINKVSTVQKYTPITGEKNTYIGSEKYILNEDGSSNYRDQMYTKTPLGGPTTPINSIVKSIAPNYSSTYFTKPVIRQDTKPPSYNIPSTPYPYQDRIPVEVQYDSDITRKSSSYGYTSDNAQNPFRLQSLKKDNTNEAYKTTIPITHSFYQPTTAIPTSYANIHRAASNLPSIPITYDSTPISDYSKQETNSAHTVKKYDISTQHHQHLPTTSQSHTSEKIAYPEKRLKSEMNTEYTKKITERPVSYSSFNLDAIQSEIPKTQFVNNKPTYIEERKGINFDSELRTDKKNSYDYTEMPPITKYKTTIKPQILEKGRDIDDFSYATTLTPSHNLRITSEMRVDDFKRNEDINQINEGKSNYGSVNEQTQQSYAEQKQYLERDEKNSQVTSLKESEYHSATINSHESPVSTVQSTNENNQDMEEKKMRDYESNLEAKTTPRGSGFVSDLQDRLSEPNQHRYPPNLYPLPSAQFPPNYFPPPQPFPNLLDKLKYQQEYTNNGILPHFPQNEYDNIFKPKPKLPLLGSNGIERYPGFHKRPVLQPPMLGQDYYDPYRQMYNNNGFEGLPGYYGGNNFLGRKETLIHDPRNKLNYGQSPFGGAGFGLRLQEDEDHVKTQSTVSSEASIDASDKYRDVVSEKVSESTYPTQNPNQVNDITSYNQISKDTYKNKENKYSIASETSAYPDSQPKYPINPSPILADDCIMRCAGNNVYNQNTLYKFVETIFRHLVERGGRPSSDNFITHSCGCSKTERELNGNDLLIDNFQDVLARGTDRRRIKLGSVYVECPENCCADNPCVDQFSRKVKIILSLISWLKDCINKK